MGFSVAKITIVGRVGKDPSTREFGEGKSLTEFTVATDRSYKKDGILQKVTTWFKINAWNKTGEVVQKVVRKGMTIYVDGDFKRDEWVDKKTGDKKTGFSVDMREFVIISGGDAKDWREGDREELRTEQSTITNTVDDSDIPF